MTFRSAMAPVALGLATIFSAQLAFADPAPPPPPAAHYVVDLKIDYFAGSIAGPPIFPASTLGGTVQFYSAGLPSPFTDFNPFLQSGPPIDIGRLEIGQEFSTRFIPGNPINISRLGFSFGGVAADFPAFAFNFPSDIPLSIPDTNPILTVLQVGPPIDVLVNGPPIRTAGAIFAYDAPVQVGTWSVSVSAALDTPEPATWAMMVLGFGGIGAALRRRRPTLAA